MKLDDGFTDHPKIIGLSLAARWAFIDSLCYCARQLTDGDIPPGKVKELGRKVRTELVAAGLWDEHPAGVVIHDYLDYNPSRVEVLRDREKRNEAKSRAGRMGAAKRWQTNGRGIADAKQAVWQTDSETIAPSRTRPVPYPTEALRA